MFGIGDANLLDTLQKLGNCHGQLETLQKVQCRFLALKIVVDKLSQHLGICLAFGLGLTPRP